MIDDTPKADNRKERRLQPRSNRAARLAAEAGCLRGKMEAMIRSLSRRERAALDLLEAE